MRKELLRNAMITSSDISSLSSLASMSVFFFCFTSLFPLLFLIPLQKRLIMVKFGLCDDVERGGDVGYASMGERRKVGEESIEEGS